MHGNPACPSETKGVLGQYNPRQPLIPTHALSIGKVPDEKLTQQDRARALSPGTLPWAARQDSSGIARTDSTPSIAATAATAASGTGLSTSTSV